MSTPVNPNDLLGRLHGVRGGSGSWSALCPAHEDHRQSLTVKVTESGKLDIQCYAGCDVADVLDSIGMALQDLYPNSNGNGQQREIATTYRYENANGTLLFEKVRYIPKDFRLRQPDGEGGWIWNLKGVTTVLYRLPELLAAIAAGERVYVCEGEKDADRLAKLGLCATTWPGGASKGTSKWRASFTKSLKGANNVVLLPDNAKPGQRSMENIARAIHSVAAEVKIVELPELPNKGDVTNWLDAGHSVDELVALVEATAAFQPSNSGS